MTLQATRQVKKVDYSDDEFRASLRATLSLNETEAASFDIERFLSTGTAGTLTSGVRSRWSRFKHCCRIDREDEDDMDGEDSSTSDQPAMLGGVSAGGMTSSGVSVGGVASQAQVARSYRRLTRWRRAYALTRGSTDSVGAASKTTSRSGSLAGRKCTIGVSEVSAISGDCKSVSTGPENAHRPQPQLRSGSNGAGIANNTRVGNSVADDEDDMYTILIKLPENSSNPASTNSSTNSSGKPLIQMIARNSNTKVRKSLSSAEN